MWNRIFGTAESIMQRTATATDRPSMVRCSSCGSVQAPPEDTSEQSSLTRCVHCGRVAWMNPSEPTAATATAAQPFFGRRDGLPSPSPSPAPTWGVSANRDYDTRGMWSSPPRQLPSSSGERGHMLAQRPYLAQRHVDGVMADSPQRSLGSKGSTCISSPSIVFRSGRHGGTAAAVEGSVAHAASLHRHVDAAVHPHDHRGAAFMSSTEKILALLSPAAARRPDESSAAMKRAPTPVLIPGNDGGQHRSAALQQEAEASMMDQARTLLRTNRERLAYRYFQSWAIFGALRQRRSVFQKRSSPQTSTSWHRLQKNDDEDAVAASDSGAASLQTAAATIWRAHEEHTQRIQTVLEELTSASASTPRQQRAAGPNSRGDDATVGMGLGAEQHQHRPLSALVQAQGAQARSLLPRQEDVYRRKLQQQELEVRESLELDFHADRAAAAAGPNASTTRGDGSHGALRHGSVVSAMIRQFSSSSTADDDADLIRRQRDDRLVAMGSAAKASALAREAELDVARVVAREQTARKVIAVSQDNAWITLGASLEAKHSAALHEDADTSIRRRLRRNSTLEQPRMPRHTSQSPGSHGRFDGSVSSPTASPSRPANSDAASPSVSTRPLRASSVRFEGTSSSDAPLAASPVIGNGRPRSGTATVGTSSSPKTPSRPASSVPGAQTPTATGDDAAASGGRRRSQSVPSLSVGDDDGGLLVARLNAAELKGRKAVIRLYKTELEDVIALFAARASAIFTKIA